MQSIKIKMALIIGSILILLFCIWNIIWFITTNNRYEDFLKAVPKSKFGNHILREDDYVYNVKRPGYLSFTGNLGVNNPDKGNSLIIWPLIGGGYQYGVRIINENSTYEILLDNQMNPINSDNEDVVNLLKETQPEIEELFIKANSMWNLH